MNSKLLVRVKASILRRVGSSLDRGHNWEKLSFQYADDNLQKYLYEFIVKLFPIFIKTENKLLISRSRNVDQARDSASLLGNHYRLLFSLAKLVNAKKVVEIGTYTGMSAITFLDAQCEVTSFDISSPFQFKDCVISDEDLQGGKLNLIIDNIYEDKIFDKYVQIFLDADIIFLDGPKFGGFEQKVLPKILNLNFKKNTIVVVDDINMKYMKILWYELTCPRLDLTILGHLSGSGVLFPYLRYLNVPSDNN